MPLIAIYGAHATGKTTALQQMWGELWDESHHIGFYNDVHLTIVFADNTADEYRYDCGVKHIKDGPPGVSAWKDKADIKRPILQDCVADDSRIWLIESARFDTHSAIAEAYLEHGGGAHVLLTTVDWKTMKIFLEERCEARGKTFRADYWTPKRLSYEGGRRYTNQAAKYFRPIGLPFEVFIIDPERQEWNGIKDYIWYELVDRPIAEWYR